MKLPKDRGWLNPLLFSFEYIRNLYIGNRLSRDHYIIMATLLRAYQMGDGRLTALAIHQIVKRNGFRLSLRTVNNYLERLRDSGLVDNDEFRPRSKGGAWAITATHLRSLHARAVDLPEHLSPGNTCACCGQPIRQ